MNDDMNSSSDASQTPFEHKVSLSTSLIAVALSLSAIYANMLGDTVLIARAEANNAWSYFQAKSMKQHFHSTQREMLLLELEQANISPNYRQKVLPKSNVMNKRKPIFKSKLRSKKKFTKILIVKVIFSIMQRLSMRLVLFLLPFLYWQEVG